MEKRVPPFLAAPPKVVPKRVDGGVQARSGLTAIGGRIGEVMQHLVIGAVGIHRKSVPSPALPRKPIVANSVERRTSSRKSDSRRRRITRERVQRLRYKRRKDNVHLSVAALLVNVPSAATIR